MSSIKFINRDQPGSDLAAGVAATFASYSLVYLKVNEDDAKDYLTRARSLLDFAIKYRGKNDFLICSIKVGFVAKFEIKVYITIQSPIVQTITNHGPVTTTN